MNISKITGLCLFAMVAGCQGQNTSAETEAYRGNANKTKCTVDGRSLPTIEAGGPAEQAPVTLSSGQTSYVGAGIEVIAEGDMNNIISRNIPVEVKGGPNTGSRGTMLRNHLQCPVGTEAQVAKASGFLGSETTKDTAISAETKAKIPWPNYYQCTTLSSVPTQNSLFKLPSGSNAFVGNGYVVAVPSEEYEGPAKFLNVFVLKGGVVAAKTRGGMNRTDLSECVKDLSI